MKKKSSKRTREATTKIVTVAARTLLTVGMLCLGLYGVYYARHSLHAGGYFKLGEVEYRGVKHLEKEVRKITGTTVSHTMTPDPVTVRSDMAIQEIAGLMVDRNFHTIPVVDEGKLVGIIGKEDVLRTIMSGETDG